MSYQNRNNRGSGRARNYGRPKSFAPKRNRRSSTAKSKKGSESIHYSRYIKPASPVQAEEVYTPNHTFADFQELHRSHAQQTKVKITTYGQ